MSNWISLEEAALKYGSDKEDFRLWAEKKEIASSYAGNALTVDDEEIQEFLSLHQTLPTRGYIGRIEELYADVYEINKLYMEVIEVQERELQHQKEVISRMTKLREILENQNDQIKEILHINTPPSGEPGDGVIRKLWKILRR